MVSAFVPGASGLVSSPGWGHCVVFLAKIYGYMVLLLQTTPELGERIISACRIWALSLLVG